MKLSFYKYQGAGNDFIIVDERKIHYNLSETQIKFICNRHFGIGADGLILLRCDNLSDFKMVYFNADGKEGTMCGNGGRSIVKFAQDLDLIKDFTKFEAVDGEHEAHFENGEIHLKMSNVSEIQKFDDHYFVNTGSPHHVEILDDISKVDVKNYGAKIRYGNPYFNEGTNVNFIEINPDGTLNIRTYERGVEDETLACGTGITAAALVAYDSGKIQNQEIQVRAIGGQLSVKFEKNTSGGYENIWLIGPADFVFKGEIELS